MVELRFKPNKSGSRVHNHTYYTILQCWHFCLVAQQQPFEDKVKYLILLGQTKEKITACAKEHGFNNVILVESLEEAVKAAYEKAKPKEAVLLSPACASWGMFPNYEVRGRMFKEFVHKLKEL